MNILLPTDFSKNSKNAIIYALNLFKNKKCNFYFLHSFPRIIYTYEEQIKAGDFGLALVKKETQKKVALLDDLTASLKTYFNTEKQNVYTIVTRDITTDAIKDTIKEKEIDLVVMGAKGETGLSNVIFGSITSYVLTKIKTPTLAIPSDYEFTPIKQVLFPSDYMVKHTSKVIQPLKEIAKLSGAETKIIHCATNELNSEQQQNSENLITLLNDIKSSKELIERDDFINVVEEKMEELDMLFMVNNKKSFFENLFFTPTVSKVVISIKKPLLVSHF